MVERHFAELFEVEESESCCSPWDISCCQGLLTPFKAQKINRSQADPIYVTEPMPELTLTYDG